MLLATLELELKVDKTLCLAFGARIVIVGEGDSARMQSCVVFTVRWLSFLLPSISLPLRTF
jgi:hypothetical protein